MNHSRKKVKLFPTFCFLGLILGLALMILKTLFGFRQSWDARKYFGVIMAFKDQAVVLAAVPSRGQLSALLLPGELFIPSFGDHGSYQLKKLPLLAEQEKNPDIFYKSISHYFGIPLHKQCWLKEESWTDFCPKGELVCLKKKFFLLLAKGIVSFKDSSCQLSLRERFLLWRFAARNDLSFSLIDFKNLVSAEKQKLVDNTEVLVVDPVVLKEKLNKMFFDPLFGREDLSLGVFNSLASYGLASQVATIITNAGGRIVKIDNTTEKIEGNCLIRFKRDNKKSYSFKMLSSLFNCSLEEVAGEEILDPEIQLFLGEKYFY